VKDTRKNKDKDYTGFILRVRHAFKLDHHCEEITAWDDELGRPVEYVNGQGSTYQKMDASEEVIAKYYAWQDKRNKELEAREKEWNLGVVDHGKVVRVVGSKRVKNVGLQGEVTAVYPTQFGTNAVYFRTTDGKALKTYTKNVQVLVNGEWVDPRTPINFEIGFACAGTY